MPMFYVRVEPNTIEGEFEAPDRESAIETAIDHWCASLGGAFDAVCDGTFDVRLVPE